MRSGERRVMFRWAQMKSRDWSAQGCHVWPETQVYRKYSTRRWKIGIFRKSFRFPNCWENRLRMQVQHQIFPIFSCVTLHQMHRMCVCVCVRQALSSMGRNAERPKLNGTILSGIEDK